MRKIVTIAVILILCMALLAGCTKDSLVGTYASDSAANKIVLRADGTAEYLGGEKAEWKSKGNKLIISIQHAKYYLEVFLDPQVLSEAEMKAVCSKINAFENVTDSRIGLNVISVTLEKEDTDNKTAQQIQQIEGVSSVSEYTWEPEIPIELTVRDGYLVREVSGKEIVYKKQ